MSWKNAARKVYEERVLSDALAQLASRFDLKGLPVSHEELRTLARRSREACMNPDKKKERLEKYKVHLARMHGADVVENLSSALEEINNAIGYEEK